MFWCDLKKAGVNSTFLLYGKTVRNRIFPKMGTCLHNVHIVALHRWIFRWLWLVRIFFRLSVHKATCMATTRKNSMGEWDEFFSRLCTIIFTQEKLFCQTYMWMPSTTRRGQCLLFLYSCRLIRTGAYLPSQWLAFELGALYCSFEHQLCACTAEKIVRATIMEMFLWRRR